MARKHAFASKISLLSAAAAALACASATHAQVSHFAVTKQAEFVQNSAAAPTTPIGWSLHTEIFFQPDDVNYCRVVPPGPGDIISMFREPELPVVAGGKTPLYATSAALDADYPAGPYTMEIVTGNLGGTSATVQMPQSVYAPIIPSISVATFAAIQAYDPATGSLHLEWAPFTTPDGFTEGEIVARLVPVGGDADFFAFEQGGPAETFSSVDVPAGVLEAEHQFTLELSYYVRNVTPNAGFDGADGEVEFLYVTRSIVTVVPEPSPACLLLIPAVAAMRRRR